MMDGHLSGSVLSVADDVAKAAVVAWSPDATATDRLLSKQTRWCGVVSAAASSEAHAVAAATKTAKTVLRKSERISVSKVTHYVTLLRFTPFFTSQAERHVRKFDKILVTLYASRRLMKSWHFGNPYLVSGH